MSDSNPYPAPAPAGDVLNDAVCALAPADMSDAFLDAIKRGVDRSQLRCNLALTPEERVQKYLSFVRLANALREAGEKARAADPAWGLK